MRNRTFFGILSAVFLACTFVSTAITARECDNQCLANERRANFVHQNPELSPKVKGAILAGKVLLGMTKKEVIAAIGEPQQSVDINASWAVREQWVYQDHEGLMFYYFKFGSVSGWHKPGAQ